MGAIKGFMEFDRETPPERPIDERLKDYREVYDEFPEQKFRDQGARCMDCGVPFCQSDTGCPLGNMIPDWNDLVYRDDWEEAVAMLLKTNNFPEFTGRICPAPCESSCVLAINEPAVTIKKIESAICERGWQEAWIRPEPPQTLTGKKVAVVGSGPAGLAAAQQLRRAGHDVTVYERDDEPGGLLMYGIPDFKLEKHHIHLRVEQMRAEGVKFAFEMEIGVDLTAQQLIDENDAVLLAIGSTVGRDLKIPGRELDGIHMAMDFLPQQNRRVAGKDVPGANILATDRTVLVLGGGDTGSDCHGTSIRQGAAKVLSVELMSRPPEEENELTPWPDWPLILRTSSSHEEGGERHWSVLTKEFIGDNGRVKGVKAVRLEWDMPRGGRPQMKEIPGSEFVWEADLVLLALGFVHPEHTVADELFLELDGRKNIKAAYGSKGPEAYKTSHPKVWAAGDSRRGQSLVVWAIHEGREAAHAIDKALMGRSDLHSIDAFGYETALPT